MNEVSFIRVILLLRGSHTNNLEIRLVHGKMHVRGRKYAMHCIFG